MTYTFWECYLTFVFHLSPSKPKIIAFISSHFNCTLDCTVCVFIRFNQIANKNFYFARFDSTLLVIWRKRESILLLLVEASCCFAAEFEWIENFSFIHSIHIIFSQNRSIFKLFFVQYFHQQGNLDSFRWKDNELDKSKTWSAFPLAILSGLNRVLMIEKFYTILAEHFPRNSSLIILQKNNKKKLLHSVPLRRILSNTLVRFHFFSSDPHPFIFAKADNKCQVSRNFSHETSTLLRRKRKTYKALASYPVELWDEGGKDFPKTTSIQ